MKTNIVLKSKSRELFGVVIRQETKSEFMNLSDLQTAYDKERIVRGWSEKRIDHILPQVENRERLYHILYETGFINVEIDTFMENCSQIGFYKYLKEIGAYKTSGRGVKKTTVCNSYVWALVAMELNPLIYAKIVIWMTDSLILNRIEAGDMYKELTRAIKRFNDVDYSAIAKALNIIVFGRHENGIRNTGTEAELKELEKLENNLAFLIDSDRIQSFAELMNEARRIWHKKYDLKPIQQ